MVNQKLVDYIQTHKSTYSITKLKSHLVDQGYSQADVDAAALEVTGNVPKIPTINSPKRTSGKSKLSDCVKWGAIYGAIAGVIIGLASILSSFLISLRFAFLAGSAGMISTSLGFVSDIFFGAIWGVLFGFMLIKFYDKLWFNTLFKKTFFSRLTFDLVLALIFSFSAPSTGAPAFIALFGGTILSDFVYAKMFAKKMGELHGYA